MSEPLIEELRCDDCAFREGTEANRYEWTRMKAQLCAEIPGTFHCHKREGLCAGWVSAANKLEAEGYYKEQPPWKKHLKKELLIIMDRAHQGEKIDLQSEMPGILERIK